MKKAFALIPLLLLCIQLRSQATEIQFDSRPWEELLVQAKQENKLVFLDAYTSWCGPCKMMAATVFKAPEVAALFNANFINTKIDMEKGEGPELRKLYGITSYPTFFFVDGDGNLVHSQSAILDTTEFIDLGKMVLDPNFNSLVLMAKRFDAGERDRGFLKDYLIRLDAGGEEFKKVMEPFLPSMLGDGLMEENSWIVFETCIKDETTETAQYFLAHRVDFERKYGVEDVQYKARELYMHMSRVAARKEDMVAFKKAQRAVRAAGLPDGAAEACWMEIDMYARKKDVPHYIKSCQKLYDATPGDDLNQKEWQGRDVASVVDKKSLLRLPLKWLRYVAQQKQDYGSLNTLALIELKMGKTKQGKATAAKAIAAAKSEGVEYEATTEMLEKYGANKVQP
jgi:thiol-disulfide isomerase/thioredoxin